MILMIKRVPTLEKIIVYLDYNVFINAMKNKKLLQKIKIIRDTNLFIFPFSSVHIGEVNRIERSKCSEIKKRLLIIKEISQSEFIDYRNGINSFTVRPRDPFELYHTINEIPQAFIDELHKSLCKEYPIADMPDNCFRPEDQIKFFIKKCRESYPNLGKKLNNMAKREAIAYLEKNVFKYKLDYLYDVMCDLTKGKIGNFDSYTNLLLDMMGYKTPNKDIEKAQGYFSDFLHISYSDICPIIISNDKNFRNKLRASYKSNEKIVLNSEIGLNYLLIQANKIDINFKNKIINKEWINIIYKRREDAISKKFHKEMDNTINSSLGL